jgi:hypothetical protein
MQPKALVLPPRISSRHGGLTKPLLRQAALLKSQGR